MGDGPYEWQGDELVEIGTDDTPLSRRALEALGEWPVPAPDHDDEDEQDEPADWYASPADERLAEQYDRDEDALREQQYEHQAGIS